MTFKTSVFLTVPLCAFAVAFACAALITDSWVDGIATGNADSEVNRVDFNFGLFTGRKKVMIAKSTTETLSLSRYCRDGACFFSCSADDADIDNLFSECPLQSRISDNTFCDGQPQEANETRILDCDVGLDYASDDVYVYDSSNHDETAYMMRRSMWATTFAFALSGIAFGVLSAIMGVYNAFVTPIGALPGLKGLIAWNCCAVVAYVVSVAVFAAEFRRHLSKAAPISETVRLNPGGIKWTSAGDANLGFSFWFVLGPVILHCLNVGLIAWFLRKWYKPKKITPIMPDTKRRADIIY